MQRLKNEMRLMKQTIRFLLFAVVLLNIAAMAQAGTVEARGYMSINCVAVSKTAADAGINLNAFLKLENRFRDTGLVYTQWNAGLNVDILEWLNVSVYYTPREQSYPGKPNVFKNVYGVDLNLSYSLGAIKLYNREANEWQATDNFYRYRNLTGIALKTDGYWPAPYVSEEFRADSDQQRINMNNFEVGLNIKGMGATNFKVLYDIETNRRLLREWQYTQYTGFAMDIKI